MQAAAILLVSTMQEINASLKKIADIIGVIDGVEHGDRGLRQYRPIAHVNVDYIAINCIVMCQSPSLVKG